MLTLGTQNFSDGNARAFKLLQGLQRYAPDMNSLSTREARDIALITQKYILSEKYSAPSGVKVTTDSGTGNELRFDRTNPFDMKNLQISLNPLLPHTLDVQTQSGSRAYYDLTVTLEVPAEKIQARDAGYAIHTRYYDYSEYQKIEIAQKKEWREYFLGKKEFEQLQYKNSIESYVQPLTKFQRGKLVLAVIEIVTGLDHEHVALQLPYPMQIEGVNPKLATE
jgi:hypothetical protein